MSKESMERIVGRAVTNREYRERLLGRPEEALNGYHLTDEEMCRIKGWTHRTFEILIHDLERQVDGLRFDCSAGFRALDDDRPRPPGKGISPAELRLLLTTCLPELCGAALHESSRDDARSAARPIRLKPDRTTLDAAKRQDVCRHGIEWLDQAETLASALADIQAADKQPDATEEPASAHVPRHLQVASAFTQVLACETRLVKLGIVRQIGETRTDWEGMCLHSCSVLYGGAYGPRRYVCPKVCGGSAFTWEESRARAVGEAVERFCAAVYDERTFVLDCQRSLAPEAIDPSSVALFSATQYREPGFAFQPFTKETRVAWTWGYSLLQRAPVLVPAALVYRPYWPIEDEAAIGDFPTTGLACGNSLADAILHGLYETVERDAIMITWLNRLPARRISLDRLAPAIDADSPWARLGRRGLFVHDITTDVAIPTRLAVLVDRSSPRVFVTVGAAAHDHPDRALEKAVAEALSLRPAVEHVVGSSAGPDTVETLEDHLTFFSNAARLHELGFLLNAPACGNGASPPTPARRSLMQLRTALRALQQRGLDAIVVDVTLPEVLQAGLRVVRVIVPGLIPLTFGHRYAAKGGQRLYTVPVTLGYVSRGLAEADLNPAPHPFA
jgi:ribosomal protein S12 methylthiotransferase accessory factor